MNRIIGAGTVFLLGFAVVCTVLSVLSIGLGFLLSLLPGVQFGHGLIAGTILAVGGAWMLIWLLINHSLAELRWQHMIKEEEFEADDTDITPLTQAPPTGDNRNG
mgnify:FL=1